MRCDQQLAGKLECVGQDLVDAQDQEREVALRTPALA